MAEYRRFISYIYAYEGDIKKKNVGFAKIEARNGQCRISISIKGAYECSGQELILYGYGYREAECLLVPLGRIPVKNGTGEAVFGKQEEDLGGSGYGLSFVKGLYLRSRGSVGKAYLTTWDDTVIQITALRNARIAGEEHALKAASLTEEKAPKALTGMEVFRQAEKTGPARVTLMDPQLLKTVLQEAAEDRRASHQSEEDLPLDPVRNLLKVPGSEEAGKVKTEREKTETEGAPAGVPEREPMRTGQEAAGESAETSEGAPEPVEERAETSGRGSAEERAEMSGRGSAEERAETSGRGPAEERAEMSGKGPAEERTETSGKGPAGKRAGAGTVGTGRETAEAGREEERAQQEAAAAAGRMPEDFYFREGFPELPLWECLEKILPRKRALAEAGWEVLQIHIQDIGRLPRENWPYGNNSFVLHGYFQYRYLILARRKRLQAKRFQSGYQYILGVPGIFKPQEKFMASMFGLPEFKRAAGNRDEDFGFWCGAVQM